METTTTSNRDLSRSDRTYSRNDKKCCQIVEKIFIFLNQGSLYDIYKMLEELRNKDEIKVISDAFMQKYDFNFLNYI